MSELCEAPRTIARAATSHIHLETKLLWLFGRQALTVLKIPIILAGNRWDCVVNIFLSYCALFSLTLVAGGSATAASFETKPLNNGGTLIFVEGELALGDEKSFANIAVAAESGVVVFKSNGGNLVAGISIGKAIRLKGFATYVPDGVDCASA